MDQITVRHNHGMFGLASQHIDGTRGLIILRVRVKKERTSKGITNPSARFILMQRPLKRAHNRVITERPFKLPR